MQSKRRSKRVLSALLAVAMSLSVGIMAFASGADQNVPEEQNPVTVDEEKSGKGEDGYFDIYLTINDTDAASVEAAFSDALMNLVGEYEGSVMSGDVFRAHVHVTNGSTHTYAYDSFTVGLPNMAEVFPDYPLTDFVAVDGQRIPLNCIAAICVADPAIYDGIFGVERSSNVTLEMLFNVYDYLAEKGYTGENAMSQCVLDYYNNKFGTNFASWAEMQLDAEVWNKYINSTANFGRNSQYKVSKEVLDALVAEHPELDPFVYVTKSSGNQLEVQLKYPDAELAALSFDVLYRDLMSVVYGDDVKTLDPIRGTVFSRSHGVGDYLADTALAAKTDAYFAGLENADALAPGETLSFDTAVGFDGPGMGNMYQLYDMSYYNSVTLARVDTSYQVVHEYYTSTDGGEYVLDGSVAEDPVAGLVGDVINVADLEKLPEYNGATYEYRGEDGNIQLVLDPASNQITLQYFRSVTTPVDPPEEVPPTGDNSSLALCAVLMAVAGGAALLISRKRRED